MGLDASVMCNCFERGRTTDPPVPRDWLRVDEDGYLNIKPEHDSDDASDAVFGWMQDCCEHPDMDHASERIGNWPSYRLFQQSLGEVGWHHFPALVDELPRANGGVTQPTMAAFALIELEEFRRAGDVGRNPCLVDTMSGLVVSQHVAAYKGLIIMDGRSGLDAGLDQNCFFIRDRATGVERFRASRFRQELLDLGRYMKGPEPGRTVFTDLDSGRSFECRMAVSGRAIPWPDGRMTDDGGRSNFEHPVELHVEVRRGQSTQFESVVGALEKVFQASVETGNPVRWC